MKSESDKPEGTTVKYAMFIYMDEKAFFALSKDEQNKVHEECGAWHAELVRTGKSRAAIGLQPSEKATTIRARQGTPAIKDGPFAEAKEVIGGLEVLECSGHEEAVQIASRFPALRVGSTVELRPLVPGDCCRAE